MKIAIPTKDNKVDDHFGHCEHFTIYTAGDNQRIVSEESYTPGPGCGCKSGLAGILRQMGVTVLLAGGIGQGAINVLNQHGIEVVRGCSEEARKLAEAYLKGELADSGESCSHHEHHHGHGGHDRTCR